MPSLRHLSGLPLVLALAALAAACGGGGGAAVTSTPADAGAGTATEAPAEATEAPEAPEATEVDEATPAPAAGGSLTFTVADKGIKKVLAITTCAEVAAGQYLVKAGDETDGATLVIKPEIGSPELTGFLDGTPWALLDAAAETTDGRSGTFSGTDDTSKAAFEGTFACQ